MYAPQKLDTPAALAGQDKKTLSWEERVRGDPLSRGQGWEGPSQAKESGGTLLNPLPLRRGHGEGLTDRSAR